MGICDNIPGRWVSFPRLILNRRTSSFRTLSLVSLKQTFIQSDLRICYRGGLQSELDEEIQRPSGQHLFEKEIQITTVPSPIILWNIKATQNIPAGAKFTIFLICTIILKRLNVNPNHSHSAANSQVLTFTMVVPNGAWMHSSKCRWSVGSVFLSWGCT